MQSQRSEFRCRLEGMLESCGLPTGVAAGIENRLTPVTYEKGAVIFLRGAPCDLVFWLLKGFVKLYLPHPDGSRTLVDLARPGDFLGFIHDRDSKGPRHLLEAHALTKCSVGLLPRDQIGPILSKLDPTATIHLLEQLNSAWSAMFERYVWFLGSPFRTQLEIVLDSLGTRFGIYDKRGTLVVPELSHEDLAEMIGSCRPMVSKLINDMIKEGLLAPGERRQLILSPKERTSSVAPSAQAPAHLNGYAKQTVGACDHARGRRSLSIPARPQSGSYGTMAK
jgi:CRP/FNR family transcriptional regulator